MSYNYNFSTTGNSIPPFRSLKAINQRIFVKMIFIEKTSTDEMFKQDIGRSIDDVPVLLCVVICNSKRVVRTILGV